MTNYNQNLKTFIWYGVVLGAMENLYKPFAVKFLERIGGTDLDISLYNALPGFIMMFAVIPGALMVRQHIHLKRSTGQMIFWSRLLVLSFALVPLLPVAMQPMAFILLTTLMNFPNAIYTSNFQGFLGDIFDQEHMAHAIGQKSKYAILSIMAVTLLSGQILSFLPKTEEQRLIIYQVFFVLSFALGMLELGIFKKFKVTEPSTPPIRPLRMVWASIFSNKPFMQFTACSLTFHFGWQMAWPLFSIYMIKTLGADEMWLSLNAIAGAIAMYFSYPFWSKQIAKRGNTSVIAVATLGMAITPILYAVSPNLTILLLMGAITGFFTSGTMTVLISGLLEVVPARDRLLAIAFYSTLTNLSLAVSPIVGHYFLEQYSIYVALYVSAFFRGIGSLTFFIRKYRNGKAQPGEA